MDRLVAVFELVEDMTDIGGWPGDRLVVRPWAYRPCVLQRSVAPHWAFDPRARLIFTDPDLPAAYALRSLRDHLPRWRRRRHLRLI